MELHKNVICCCGQILFWDCRICHRHLCKAVRPPAHECPDMTLNHLIVELAGIGSKWSWSQSDWSSQTGASITEVIKEGTIISLTDWERIVLLLFSCLVKRHTSSGYP